MDGVPTAVATFAVASDGTAGRIDVLEWRSEWRVAASFDVVRPGVLDAPDPLRPLLARDVTNDGEPDFVVPLAAASASPYQVLSNDGGAWRQVPFGSDERIVVLDPDAPTADRFVTSSNLCDPTCADGRYRRERWRYSPPEARFILVAEAICDALGDGEWRCDPPDAGLTTGVPIHATQSTAVAYVFGTGADIIDSYTDMVPVNIVLPPGLDRAELVRAVLEASTAPPEGAPTATLRRAMSPAALPVVSVEGSRVVLDWNPDAAAPELGVWSTSAGSTGLNLVLAMVFENDPVVEVVEMRLAGSCERFTEIMQGLGCQLFTRERWAQFRDA